LACGDPPSRNQQQGDPERDGQDPDQHPLLHVSDYKDHCSHGSKILWGNGLNWGILGGACGGGTPYNPRS
jgi:hypothetical protein